MSFVITIAFLPVGFLGRQEIGQPAPRSKTDAKGIQLPQQAQ
jgi:hypothetical protein